MAIPPGLEGLAMYSPVAWWRLSVNYSYMQMSLTPLGADYQPQSLLRGLDSPQSVRRAVLLQPAAWRGGLRRAARPLGHRNPPEVVNGTGDPGYQELDLNAIWRATPHLTLSLEGRSLLHASHVEFGDPDERSAIERSVFGRLTWHL